MNPDSPPVASLPRWVFPFLLLATLAVMWAFRPPNPQPEQPIAETRQMMDTLVTLKAWGPPGLAGKAIQAGFQAMDQVDRMASFFRPDSDLSILNQTGSLTTRCPIFELLEKADWSFRATAGMFDPTFSVISRAYGFYDQKGRQPTPGELSACLTHAGWDRQIRLGSDSASLDSGSQIDLGGIAGGFAIESAINAMHGTGCSTLFIDDGGDLWMEGKKPDGEPWRVAVRDPRDQGVLAVVESESPVAISTSGDYERFVMVGNHKINHIFDPKTGYPAEYYRSVTVIASSPLLADVWSTALFAMSPAEALATSRREALPALFLPASGATWMSDAGSPWFLRVKP